MLFATLTPKFWFSPLEDLSRYSYLHLVFNMEGKDEITIEREEISRSIYTNMDDSNHINELTPTSLIPP